VVDADDRRAGRRAQFEREALQHLDAMYSFALKLSRARDDAEDLVSDTLLRAFERWEQYRSAPTSAPGCSRSSTTSSSAASAASTRARCSSTRTPTAGRRTRPVGEVDPEGRFYDSFLDEEITRAIEALPVEYRAAVVLSDVQGLRYARSPRCSGARGDGEVAAVPRAADPAAQARGYAVDMGYLKAAPTAA
jgi:RNA polymerase sigma-70 factor (ECF subfamily)